MALREKNKRNAAMVKNRTSNAFHETKSVQLTVNGKAYRLEVGTQPHQIDPSHTLLHTLRETLGLTGAKAGCDQGACGGCTVILDERATLACITLTVECDGKQVTTIEGLQNEHTGRLDPLQQAFADHTAFQCGFCTPGIIMTARALLDENPRPTPDEIKEALSGNYCRCISHYHVIDAVMDAAEGDAIHE
jgi:aerobic-type carbon monoxide dehydrogenase small subunit (CoxS/CutS family)